MTSKQKMPKRVDEQRRAVVEQVVKDMEAMGLEWTKPWKFAQSPCNPVSGTLYRGSNRIALTMLSRLYGDPRWCTFAQGKQMGWKLKKGSKSSVVEKWKEITIRCEEDEDDGKVVKFPRCVGYWSVFNASQFEGAPEYHREDHGYVAGECDAVADRLIESSRCPVEEDRYCDVACYKSHSDKILIPDRSLFDDASMFVGTLLHEMVHSTAHGSALARVTPAGWSTEAGYAREELVAELGSVFAAEDIGIDASEPRSGRHWENHVAYLKSWISCLKDDPDELYRAAAKADAAAGYVVGRYGAVSPSAS